MWINDPEENRAGWQTFLLSEGDLDHEDDEEDYVDDEDFDDDSLYEEDVDLDEEYPEEDSNLDVDTDKGFSDDE